jgi:glycosyltransferase involved in cell wall biosynthesis
MKFDLSYIIATRNRLPFLKITLNRLLGELQPGEEIVVVDGDSTDGAKDYLQQLFDDGKIHQYISEPDHNQAHGWNKAMLMARGTIIKKIIDDDVFSFHAIKQCKDMMLLNPEIDICISDGLETHLNSLEYTSLSSRLNHFNDWKIGKIKCFTFSDAYMLIRRSSLSYLGLYDTQFRMMDWEYALRCSFLKAKIAYYTGCTVFSVGTPDSVTSGATEELLKTEALVGEIKYGYKGDFADIPLLSKIKIAIGKAINYQKHKFPSEITEPVDLPGIYNDLYIKLEDHNRQHPGNFFVS